MCTGGVGLKETSEKRRMHSFKALHASYDSRVTGGGGHEARLARGAAVNQEWIGCETEEALGIITRKRSGADGDVDRTRRNKHNMATRSTQGRLKKRRSLLPFLDIL